MHTRLSIGSHDNLCWSKSPLPPKLEFSAKCKEWIFIHTSIRFLLIQSNNSLIPGLWDFILSSSVKFKLYVSYIMGFLQIYIKLFENIRRCIHRAGLHVNEMPSCILPHNLNVWYVILHFCYLKRKYNNCISICLSKKVLV